MPDIQKNLYFTVLSVSKLKIDKKIQTFSQGNTDLLWKKWQHCSQPHVNLTQWHIADLGLCSSQKKPKIKNIAKTSPALAQLCNYRTFFGKGSTNGDKRSAPASHQLCKFRPKSNGDSVRTNFFPLVLRINIHKSGVACGATRDAHLTNLINNPKNAKRSSRPSLFSNAKCSR